MGPLGCETKESITGDEQMADKQVTVHRWTQWKTLQTPQRQQGGWFQLRGKNLFKRASKLRICCWEVYSQEKQKVFSLEKLMQSNPV